jgi:hypothetical protein
MVETDPLSVPIVVANLVSTTYSVRAGITCSGLKSVRTKQIPVLAGDGFIFKEIFSPECSPIPNAFTDFFSVC